MTVRTATAADLDAVDALLRRVYPKLLKEDYAPSIRVLVLPRISRAQPRLVTSGTYFVVERDAEIVGAGGWTRDGRDGTLGHVRHVVTSDRHLRRGVGRELMAHVFATARAAGIARMVCWSTFTGAPFYAAMGFVQRGEIEVPLGQVVRFPAVEMWRDL